MAKKATSPQHHHERHVNTTTPVQLATVISLLRLPEVKRRTGWGRSTIYSAMARGDFPQAVTLGPRSVAWRSDDIDKWIAGRIAASGKTAA